MKEKYFCIFLDDYAMPGFCSADKEYFGTIEDLQAFKENLDDTSNLKQHLEAFINGDLSVTHIVAYNEHVLGKKATCYGKKECIVSQSHIWIHKNIWGCDYKMCFSKCESEHIWIKIGKKYCRCIKPVFYDLGYYNDFTDKYDELNHFWGQPDYFYMKNNMLKALLYVEEVKFDTKEEMLQDFENFTADKSCYNEVINEIFGDG